MIYHRIFLKYIDELIKYGHFDLYKVMQNKDLFCDQNDQFIFTLLSVNEHRYNN